jgi:hypothetical protein
MIKLACSPYFNCVNGYLMNSDFGIAYCAALRRVCTTGRLTSCFEALATPGKSNRKMIT